MYSTIVDRIHVIRRSMELLFTLYGGYLRTPLTPSDKRQFVRLGHKKAMSYARQQPIYHFYLLNALAIMLLAVCHAPSMFTETCRDSFAEAVELVKGFSRHSRASRRLWKSIRGLLPIVKSLGGHGNFECTSKLTESVSGEWLTSNGEMPFVHTCALFKVAFVVRASLIDVRWSWYGRVKMLNVLLSISMSIVSDPCRASAKS